MKILLLCDNYSKEKIYRLDITLINPVGYGNIKKSFKHKEAKSVS